MVKFGGSITEILQTIIQLVLTPTLIVGALAFLMRELFKSYLSMDVERYKSELQNDLETHKISLKAEYDLRHFEFQTRFSVLHQERAKVIQELFGLFASLEKSLKGVEALRRTFNVTSENKWFWEFAEKQTLESKGKALSNLLESYLDLFDFYSKKRIFLEEEVCERIERLEKEVLDTMSFHFLVELHKEIVERPIAKEKLDTAISKIAFVSGDEVSATIKIIERQFRAFLSAEIPNYQLEKK